MSKGLAGIMKQAQMIQQKMAKLQEEAALKEAEATAGRRCRDGGGKR
jgi:Uncharacterised BCR, YbaB family COG0718.